jgi:hypothetical protein
VPVVSPLLLLPPPPGVSPRASRSSCPTSTSRSPMRTSRFGGYLGLGMSVGFSLAWRRAQELFSTVGTVKSCNVHYDRNGRSSGSAEVVFAAKAAANDAISQYSGILLDGEVYRVVCVCAASVWPLTTASARHGNAPRGNRGSGGPAGPVGDVAHRDVAHHYAVRAPEPLLSVDIFFCSRVSHAPSPAVPGRHRAEA